MERSKSFRQAGFSLIEVLVALAVVAIILGIITLAVPRLMGSAKADEFLNELSAIEQGLASFYKATYRFPRGSGWTWTSAGEYVDTILQQKGWQYACSGSTITLTTPPIADAKVRAQVRDKFSSRCSSVAISGASVVCVQNDRPCP